MYIKYIIDIFNIHFYFSYKSMYMKLLSKDEFYNNNLLSEMFDDYDEYCHYIIEQMVNKLEDTI